jgi:MFS family permease
MNLVLTLSLVGRFLAGVGTGHASFANPLYITENAPRAIRGGLTGLYQLFIVFGIFLSFWVRHTRSQNRVSLFP